MKQISKNTIVVLFCLGMCSHACVTSKIKPLAEVGSSLQTDSLSVRIFLLERDIPKDIEQLGVVSLSTLDQRPSLNTDKQVKRQLQTDCQRLGANGAYRINDGTYYPSVVSYLVFKYRK